jgi:quercetin dioxygenase-like cupin family protein
MEIKRSGSQPSGKGPADWFTGTVRIDPLFQPNAPACAAGAVVTFEPGAVIWFPSGEKHWHGASATTAMTHIAIQEALDGKAVDWMEKVTDERYQRRIP